MSKEQKKLIFGGLLMIFAYGLSNNIVAYYITPVTQSMGFTRAAFNFSFTLMSIVSFLIAPFYGYLFMKIPVRRIVFAGALIGSICYLGYAMCRSLFMFYAVGILQGMVQSGTTNMAVVVLIQRFFDEQKSGTATGIIMAGTGVCSMVMSSFLPQFIEHYGWSVGYLLCGVLWATVMLIAVGLIREYPQEKNKQKTGRKEEEGVTYHQAVCCGGFYILLVCILFFNVVMVCSQHLPSYFRDMGMDNHGISQIMMLFSLGLIMWKIILGKLYDCLGAIKATMIAYVSFIVGMWMLAVGSELALAAGSLIAALGIASSTVLTPLLTKKIFGGKEYAPIWSLVSMSTAFGVAIRSPAWGSFYDCFGSYRPAFLGAPIFLAAALCMFLMLLHKRYY